MSTTEKDYEHSRSGGWQHAKLSGHKNEEKVCFLFNDEDYQKTFAKRALIPPILYACIGGKNEKNVPCVLGNSTKSKTDLTVYCENNHQATISIKKSEGGQVYLIGVDRFIEGFEKQFNTNIPEEIKDSIRLYFFGHPNIKVLLEDKSVTRNMSDNLISYQKRHGRLVWDAIKNYNPKKANDLLLWFKDEISHITDFCFSRGLAINTYHWANYVWYINKIGESNVDVLFNINELCKNSNLNKDLVTPGTTNGGSTILLPFGFVQWHQEKIQFHHSLNKLLTICN